MLVMPFHELEGLTGNAAFTVAEFAVDTATIFEISRDEHGTPTSFLWKYRYEDDVLLSMTTSRTGGWKRWLTRSSFIGMWRLSLSCTRRTRCPAGFAT